MALDDANRRQVWAHIMRLGLVPPDVTKPDFRAAVDSADNLIESSLPTLNSSLPDPYKTSATAEQKAKLYAFLFMRRAGILSVEGD